MCDDDDTMVNNLWRGRGILHFTLRIHHFLLHSFFAFKKHNSLLEINNSIAGDSVELVLLAWAQFSGVQREKVNKLYGSN